MKTKFKKDRALLNRREAGDLIGETNSDVTSIRFVLLSSAQKISMEKVILSELGIRKQIVEDWFENNG